MRKLYLTLLALPLSFAALAVAPITGPSTICPGASGTYTDATSGGVWSSSAPAIITVSTGGVATPVTSGVAIISYTVAGSSAMLSVTVTPSPTGYAITGGGSYCAGGTGDHIGLSGSDLGTTYQVFESGTLVGTSIPGTGSSIDFGLFTSPGTYTILATSTIYGCTRSMTGSETISISPLPTAFTVTGGGSYCAGGTGVDVSLTASSSGINYQLYRGSTPVGTAVIGTASAIDFGMETAAGTYTVIATNPSTGCTALMSGSAVVAVNPLPVVYAVTGTGTYCSGSAGLPISLDGSDAGIDYQTYYGSVVVGVPVLGTGGPLSMILATSAGTYTVVATDATTGCTSDMTGSAIITVATSPTVTASATEATCGGSYTLTAGGATSYSWSPSTGLSCGGCATPTCSGLASSATYTVMGTDGSGCTGTASVTVNFNRVYGHITYTGGISTDVFKVWLIQFNPSDSSITALDSVNSCMDAGIPYYEFSSPASGSYMAKAKLDGTVAGTSGYLPTYSSSTPNWYDAASAAHTTGADAMNITMVYGTVPAGPGFISGYVTAGAGRGTSGDVPAVDMIVYLKDASGHILTYTYTDGTGMYSFSALANGSYIIYPENYSFYTTPSSVITLSTSAESVTGINFKQHNTYGTITPLSPTSTSVATATAQEFNIYPNPTTGNIFIQWANKTTGNAEVTITDVTGRVVIASAIKINTTSGQSQINVSDLNNGIYLISIKGESVNYNGKVMVQH